VKRFLTQFLNCSAGLLALCGLLFSLLLIAVFDPYFGFLRAPWERITGTPAAGSPHAIAGAKRGAQNVASAYAAYAAAEAAGVLKTTGPARTAGFADETYHDQDASLWDYGTGAYYDQDGNLRNYGPEARH